MSVPGFPPAPTFDRPQASVRYNYSVPPIFSLVLLALMQAGPPAEKVPLNVLQDMRAGKYAEARVALQRQLQQSPQSVTLWRYLGQVEGRLYDKDAAIAAYRKVLDLQPNDAGAHADLGVLLWDQKQPRAAVSHLRRAVELDPASSNYSLRLAEVLLRAKDYDAALKFLNSVHDRFANLMEYRFEVAWTHYGLQDFADARAEWETLARENPNSARIQFSLGNCDVVLGRLTKAESEYRKAISLQPRNASYYAGLGTVLRRQGKNRIDEAMSNLSQSLTLYPTAEAQVQLALCFEEKSDLERAEKLLEAAVRTQPDLLTAHRVLARVYYRHGKKALGDSESSIVSKLDAEDLHKSSHLLGLAPLAVPDL